MVSYGPVDGAQFWLTQTGHSFDMLHDADRTVYKAFGLGSSFSKVMRFDYLLRYSELTVANRKFPEVPPQFIDDVFQMGGDYVLDQEGRVIHSHPCRSPLDRPTVGQILAVASALPSQ